MIPNPSLATLSRKIAFSTLVQYAGKAVKLGLSILTLKLISNFLSQQDYGVYSAISEYVLFFATIANLGIFGQMVRSMADAPKDGKIFINTLLLRMVTAGFFGILAVVILLWRGTPMAFVLGSVIFLGSVMFDYVVSVCTGMLQANYLMGRATIADLVGRAVNYGMIVWLVHGMEGTALGMNQVALLFIAPLVSTFITAGLSLFFVIPKLEWSWEIDRRFMLKILWAGLPFGLINIINSLYFRFLPDYFAHMGLTDEQFGSFSIWFRGAQIVSLFSTFLMFSALPGLKEYLDSGHLQKAKLLYKRICQLLAVAGVGLVVFGSLLGPWVITLLTHKKYILPEFWFVLPLMLLLAAISYGYDLILITLFALKKDLWLLKRELMALAVSLVVFGFSLLMVDAPMKLLVVMLAAILGESIMVISGLLKIKKLWS